MLKRTLGILAVVIAALTPALSGTAQAQAETGTLILASDAGISWPFSYSQCSGFYDPPPWLPNVVRFHNRPPAGCVAHLVNGVSFFPMCIGVGRVPPAYQNSPQVGLRPGTSVSCY